jgi:SAM-dependent methyltransferase
MTDKPHTGDPASLAGQRAHTMPGQRAVNLLVRGPLRTPGLAPIVGGRLVTLYVVGRKSGRHYCVPVAYMAEGNDLLIGTSSGWGRNLRTGQPVAIRLKGKRRRAGVQVSTTEPEVVSAYAHMAVRGDIRTMAFPDGEFDAIVSIDAFEYFGTDVHLLPSLMRVLRPGGRIAISTPALRHEPYEVGIPAHVEAVFGWEAAAWHAPAWWVRHWELSGLVGNIQAQWQTGGRDDWLLWARAVREAGGNARSGAVIATLEADTDEQLGFALVSAQKQIRKAE